VLDLGCGKGPASIFLAKHFNVKVIAVDLWTPAAFLDEKFTARGYRDRIVPLNLDVTRDLPFAENYFDAIFCMNSFNFYGGSVDFVQRLLKHLKPGGQLCLGSEVLSAEFTAEQLQHPPEVFAFQLPAPNEHVNVFEGDFQKQRLCGGAIFSRKRAYWTWNIVPNSTMRTPSMKSWYVTSMSITSIRSMSIFAYSKWSGVVRTIRARRCSC
jgi:SAM-dependent methyltransferase